MQFTNQYDLFYYNLKRLEYYVNNNKRNSTYMYNSNIINSNISNINVI